MLSLAAAHLEYLRPGDVRYHSAKYGLLDRTLHDYRCALSAPITASNSDALFAGAVLVHYLLWSDLSFLDSPKGQSLDLSSDRLYWLSTGQRQIFFMAWPLFQRADSAFASAPILGPCMTLSDEVDARGLPWRPVARQFAALYDNWRYRGGGRGGPVSCSDSSSEPSSSPSSSSSASPSASDLGLTPGMDFASTLYLASPSPRPPALTVLTLWESYKEGEAFVSSGATPNEAAARAAYLRLSERVARAMVFVAEAANDEQVSSCIVPDAAVFRSEHVVRYVLTFAMLCFGPLLPLISAGDSRVLVLLYHVYRVTARLLPGDGFWWCRRRAEVMQQAIRDELSARGLGVCLRGADDTA